MNTAAPSNSPVATAQRIEELGRIIMAYSEVTDRLQQSHDQLQQTVESLRGELSEKNRLLERRNRLAALGEMAAGMAHEIRNPLGGIQLYASMLAKDVSERADSLQLVTKISAGVKRLEGLVSQVLHFTREITASVTATDLSEVVAQAVELSHNAMLAREIVCEVDGPAQLPVVADPVLIGQALLNLLLNAADATPSGGRVSVVFGAPTSDSGARQFHVVLRDSGTGIPAAILDKVFNPFFTTKDNGTGLGLAIVHRIVEAHEGTISVTNPADGGARFEIRI
ncbi:MAG: ATP-binding protein [Tepidisphaeraceae bacterium]